jgi:pimeloyl-ACP methyl ester carboxylesterase
LARQAGARLTRVVAIAISVLAALLAGCVSSVLARKVVAPPNQSGIRPLFADSPLVRNAPIAFADTWKVRVGGVDIAVAAIEPGDYGFRYDLQLEYVEGRDPILHRLDAFWRSAGERVPNSSNKGTIVLLHGYLQDKRFVTPWALRLAEAGFRCALIDLRGHGDSSGRHITFGALEARDVTAVIDDLAARGWDVARVGVFGVSYGASVALLSAGRDPRVRAVVAFEPFASAERAVPELMRGAFAAQARGISDRQFAAAHVKQARIAGFDWSEADVPAALGRSTAPVLLLHGESDSWLSPAHSRELIRHAPQGSRLEIAPRDNHVTLPLRVRAFESLVIDWFATLSSR